MDYLFNKSDMFSYDILKNYDEIYDNDDKRYYDNILKTERVFQCFYKKKNVDKE